MAYNRIRIRARRTLSVLLAAALNCSILLTGGMSAFSRLGIGLNDAKYIAVEDAGVKAGSAHYIAAGIDGGKEYVIRFLSGNTAYEYEINVLSGTVNYRARTKLLNASGSDNEISPSKARKIALVKSGGDSDSVKFIKTELTVDSRKLVYDVRLLNEKDLHSFQIDAYSGAVLESEKTRIRNYVSGKSLISKKKAIEIALKAAGYADEEMDYLHAELTVEKNMLVQKIVFEFKNVEFEYEVDAYTGEIRKIQIN